MLLYSDFLKHFLPLNLEVIAAAGNNLNARGECTLEDLKIMALF
jgi:hypothetical protein